jgi:ubiquinone/menaquinone biosynthesis C-methylase UbiE
VSASPVRRVFDALSRVYDLPPVQLLVYRPAQDAVLREVRAAGARRVLDVGCGTGQLTARLPGELRADVVCGCDFSAGMLAQACARSRRVGWVQADAMRLPVRDGAVDAVISTEAFHFFDQPAALAEFHRVLAPGGRLVVALVNPRTAAGSRLLRANVRGAGTWPTQQRMRAMVEAAGFEVRAQRRVVRIFGLLVPTIMTVGMRR